MKFFLVLVFFLTLPLESFAKRSGSLSKSKSKSFEVLEIGKTTNVYKAPNFDSKILMRLESGRRVVSTKKVIQGTDGFGLFYKVKLRKDVYGYVVDTDIKGFKASGVFSKSQKKGDGFFRRRNKNQIFSPTKSRSFGFSYAYMDYSLAISNQTLSSKSSFFGFKLTGSWLSPNLPLDVTLLISSKTPSLLDRVSTESEGFFGFLDVLYQSVFIRSFNSELYWTIGPAISYYNFDILFSGESELKSSSQLDLGVSLGLSYAYNLGLFLIRFEGRYIKTNEPQIVGLMSVQRYF